MKKASAAKEPARPNAQLEHVPFDWHNTDTWDDLFPTPTTSTTATTITSSTDSSSSSSSITAGSRITAVFLIAPPTLGTEQLMTDLVDLARGRGVRRFVLLSASAFEAGGPAMGRVHGYLRGLGARGEVEWAALRPSWFQRLCFFWFFFSFFSFF